MVIKLPPDMQAALERQNGGPVHVEGTATTYVLMSMDVYRELMGVGPDDEFEASVRAVRRGYEAVQQGKTRSFEEFLDDFRQRHELSD